MTAPLSVILLWTKLYTAFKDKANNKMKVRETPLCTQANLGNILIKTKNLNINHEQGHFDIAEIYARKLRKEFLENVKTEKDYQLKFKLIYQVMYGEFLDYQNVL